MTASDLVERHADLPRRVIRRLAGGQPTPLEDLVSDTWIRILAEVREVPADRDHQRSLVAQYAAWVYRGYFQRRALPSNQAERGTRTIGELADRRRRGERYDDPDDVVIGLAWHQTVEQTVLAREQLRVIRAAVAQMTPSARLGLAAASSDWCVLAERPPAPKGPRLGEQAWPRVRALWGRVPATEIARRLGCRSETSVVRVARAMGLPPIGRGYWKKLDGSRWTERRSA